MGCFLEKSFGGFGSDFWLDRPKKAGDEGSDALEGVSECELLLVEGVFQWRFLARL